MFDLILLQEAAVDATTAAAKTSFGPMQALQEGGPVSWSIAGTLVIMSAVSWYIMLTKLFEQHKQTEGNYYPDSSLGKHIIHENSLNAQRVFYLFSEKSILLAIRHVCQAHGKGNDVKRYYSAAGQTSYDIPLFS